MKNIIKLFFLIFLSLIFLNKAHSAGEKIELLKTDWSFKGFFGKFDRGSLQRGYQVYTEVCASCHSMKYLSYRNLSEKGGPEFTEEQAKAIASKEGLSDSGYRTVFNCNKDAQQTVFHIHLHLIGGRKMTWPPG